MASFSSCKNVAEVINASEGNSEGRHEYVVATASDGWDVAER